VRSRCFITDNISISLSFLWVSVTKQRVLDAVGPDLDKSWIGKQVSTVPAFSLNEYSVVGETAVVPIEAVAEYPANLSPAEGTAIWMQYVTAYGALRTIAKVTKGISL
jgi:NADPH:quinone reductase-like Zn-dependent oxidoreductase